MPFHRLRVNSKRYGESVGNSVAVGAGTKAAALGAVPTAEIPPVRLQSTSFYGDMGMFDVEDPPALPWGALVDRVEIGAEFAGLPGLRNPPDIRVGLWSNVGGQRRELAAIQVATQTLVPNRVQATLRPPDTLISSNRVDFLNNLALWLQAYVPAVSAKVTDTNQLMAFDGYADLFYVEKPAVALIGPDAVIGTGRPTISWNYLRPVDGYPQAYVQLFVHSAAQVAATPGLYGLDPAYVYGPNLWLYQEWTSQSEVQIGTDLGDGSSYRISMRVVQLVNGQMHWSDWAFRDFFVAVSPPAIPGVFFVRHDNADGRLMVLVRVPDVADGDTDGRPDVIELQRSHSLGDERDRDWTSVRSTFYDLRGLTIDPYPVSELLGAPSIRYVEYSDWDVGNGEGFYYRTRGINIGSADPNSRASSAWNEEGEFLGTGVTNPNFGSWSSARTFVRHPSRPWQSIGMVTMEGSFDQTESEGRAGLFEVLGRAEPVMVSDVRSSRSTTLKLGITDVDRTANFDSEGGGDPTIPAVREYRRLRKLLSTGGAVLVLAPYTRQFGDVWQRATVAVGKLTEQLAVPKIDDMRRVFTLPIREVTPLPLTVPYETFVPLQPYDGNEAMYVAAFAPWAVGGTRWVFGPVPGTD